MNLLGLLLVAVGIFTICGAAFDWNFFMESRKARLFVSLFGRTIARVFYCVLGLGLTVFGVLITFGILRDAT